MTHHQIEVLLVVIAFFVISAAIIAITASTEPIEVDVETFTFIDCTGLAAWQIRYLFEPGLPPIIDNPLYAFSYAPVTLISVRFLINNYGREMIDLLSHQQINELEIIVYNQHMESGLSDTSCFVGSNCN